MKSIISKKIAMLSLAGLMVAGPAPAIVCLAPHPVCGVVLVGGLIVSIIASRDAAKNGHKMDPILLEQNQASLGRISRKLEGTNYLLRMQKYERYSPGYRNITSRYNNGKISGNLSLESLMNFSPRLFQDLDTLEKMLAEEYGTELVVQVYGEKYEQDGSLNWKRYSLLAQDAIAIYSNSFKN